MNDSSAIIEMVRLGGVYYHICGTTAEGVFKDAVSRIALPEGVDSTTLIAGLTERERLMSTSIGSGVALPHPRVPLITDTGSERIYVCYLDRGVNFDAMDGVPIHVMFLILSTGSTNHLNILSRLSYVLQKPLFREALRGKPDTEELIELIKKHFQGEKENE
ncbi:MAG TPA: PTS sugar transporter subunit IIA [Treponema sp.]|nr:PTS sugar transporter subunit IIA [Treponema sp.]